VTSVFVWGGGGVQDPEALRITNPQLVEALLKLTLYNPPAGAESSTPAFAVVTAYWNALVLLVLIGAFNVKHVAQAIWQRFTPQSQPPPTPCLWTHITMRAIIIAVI
jgi:hypothetical protein